jgi:hypothetical protein
MGYYRFSQSAPRVAEVLVSGATWSAAMLSRLEADGLGSGGYRVPIEAGPSFSPLPWTNLNRIAVRFTENVVVTQNDLTVVGMNRPNYVFSGFGYDPATFTATWTVNTPISVDKLRLTLGDSVTSQSGTPLDGDVGAAYPSGNGSAGGDFTLRFDVLPGDVSQNRVVDGNDFQAIVQAAQNGAAHAAYRPLRDLDGNGAINVLDLHSQLSRQGTTLPAGNPPSSPPAPSAPASVVVAATSTSERAAVLRRTRPTPIAVDQAFRDNGDSTDSVTVLRARRGRMSDRGVDRSLSDLLF